MAKAEVTLKISPTELNLILTALESLHDEHTDQVKDYQLNAKCRSEARTITNRTAELIGQLRS